MASKPLSPAEFLEELKKHHKRLHWEPIAPERRETYRTEKRTARTKESVQYLHDNWVLPDQFEAGQAGKGLRGNVQRLLGPLVYRALGPYLRRERDLIAHMVRAIDGLERRCDELDDLCTELIDRSIERQVAEAANLAHLAAWLHAEQAVTSSDRTPVAATSEIDASNGAGVPGHGARSTHPR